MLFLQALFPKRGDFFAFIHIFGCAEDTPARQCSNKFDIALAYSYLCSVIAGPDRRQ